MECVEAEKGRACVQCQVKHAACLVAGEQRKERKRKRAETIGAAEAGPSMKRVASNSGVTESEWDPDDEADRRKQEGKETVLSVLQGHRTLLQAMMRMMAAQHREMGMWVRENTLEIRKFRFGEDSDEEESPEETEEEEEEEMEVEVEKTPKGKGKERAT